MTEVVLPNIRKLFRTDPGFIQFEADLKGADVWTVVYEAEDDELKRVLKSGIDLHAHNAEAMWGTKFTSLDPASHAYDQMRQGCKHTIHGIHFGCTPRTTAVQRGWLVSEAERFHNRWFSIHPGIRRFQDRVRYCLEKDRTVTNKFGFRMVYFDRIDNCFTEALAWIPQSTTALCSYRGLLQLEKHYWPHQQVRGWMPSSNRDLEGIILQTHDSGNFQFPTWCTPPIDEIKRVLSVTVPYDDPMTIPWGLKQSTKSWGELEKCE